MNQPLRNRQAARNPRTEPAQLSRKRDDAEQSKRFIEKARELDASGDHALGDLLMGRLAEMKPAPRTPKKGRAAKSNH